MKYCEEIIQEIERGLKCGLSQKAVCEGVGISAETFNQWSKKAEFSERIKKAVFERKKLLLTKVLEHGKKHWQAIAWLLERCHPDEFGIRVRQEVQYSGKIEHEYSEKTTPEEISARFHKRLSELGSTKSYNPN